jgi:predicted  nucleic acid-binding Zn-ribbon protein
MEIKMKLNQEALNYIDGVEVTEEQIRGFVKVLAEANEKISEANKALKEALDGHEEYSALKDEAKDLRLRMKALLEGSQVLQDYLAEVNEAKQDKKDIISQAKMDGIPKGEIDEAIRMLKKDIDPTIAKDIYINIADLVDPDNQENQ